jgi:predicted GIY-YIG superfamily endonuclease
MKIGYIYRYLHNDEVVYVGQTKNPLKQRVKQHCKEVAFLGLTHIQYIEVVLEDKFYYGMSRKLSATEEYYIDKYNPILNNKKTPKFLEMVEDRVVVQEEEWIEYTDKLPIEFPKFYDIFSK